MDLHFSAPFKSILASPTAVELPKFTVITGLNGSGKTHLLQGLVAPGISGSPFYLTEDGRRLERLHFAESKDLAPNEVQSVSRALVQKEMDDLCVWYGKVPKSSPDALLKAAGGNRPRIENIARLAGKRVVELSEEDIRRHLPTLHDPANVFAHNFAQLFMRYAAASFDNEFREFRAKKGHQVAFLTAEEFVQQHGGPPWELVNRIIQRAGLSYRLTFPTFESQSETPFELRLASAEGHEIKFADLSSGEKTLMALGLAAYNSSNQNLLFPSVLLLDEPDAHLHPQMARQLLDVLQDVFVSEKRVKVAITTHSPTTVALAPAESLFVMSRGSPRLSKTTKDEALSVLTSGVPTLSVLYENRRQVFVESENDVSFYEPIYSSLRERGKLQAGISVSFVSSGIAGSGNCDAVRKAVETLRGAGNRFVFGLLDWDLTNKEEAGVVVLGVEKRYAVDNYLLDPVLLGVFLERERIIAEDQIGCSYGRFLYAPDDVDLQKISNFVVTEVKLAINANRKTQVLEETLEDARYVGGRNVQVPRWYFRTRGHDLESAITGAFPALRRYSREGDLKRDIIQKVLRDIPALIPSDILAALEPMQAS